MGMVMLQALMSQCLLSSLKEGMMTTCHGPSQERSPSHYSTNWKIRTVYRRSVSFPQDDRRVVGDGRAYFGYGQYKFIPHYQLARDADQNCQYLKNDCLYFEIKVHITEAMKPWLTCTV